MKQVAVVLFTMLGSAPLSAQLFESEFVQPADPSAVFSDDGGSLQRPLREIDPDLFREPTFEDYKNSLRLREVPEVTPGERPRVDAESAERIKRLIADLANVERPVDESMILMGWGFLPTDGQKESWGLRLVDHHMEWSPALQELVEIGPDALPYLLEALSDETRTRVCMEQDGAFGGMWHAREMWENPHRPFLNPFHPREEEVLRTEVPPPRTDHDFVSRCTLTVGDLCYVAIGQIVGREYVALRYQRTACYVINSPTHDPELADRVRRIWSSDDPRTMLFESLLRDFCTEDESPEESQRFDEYGLGSRLQNSAARRLLYYFPEESTPLIVERLQGLEVNAPADGPAGLNRCHRLNRVNTLEFIESVAWSDRPDVREALTGVFQRANEVEILVAAAPGVDDPEGTIISTRFQELMDELPAGEDGINSDRYKLLLAWVESAPQSAEGAMQRFITTAEVRRVQTACSILNDCSPEWKVEFLRPLLDDTRDLGVNFRVCDSVALILADDDETLTFRPNGSIEEADRQIAAMKEELDRRIAD